MKRRLLVMNGQKILQNFNENEWKTTGLIKKAEEGIKPGIYNIYLAKKAETENKAPTASIGGPSRSSYRRNVPRQFGSETAHGRLSKTSGNQSSNYGLILAFSDGLRQRGEEV